MNSFERVVSAGLGLVGMALCFVALATPAHAAQLAVLEVTGPTVRSGELDPAFVLQLTDHIRAGALKAAPEYGLQVLSREKIGVLVERSGGACVEAECEVQTGRNLGVDHVMSGRLMRIEGQYVLTIKVHTTESGKMLASNRSQSGSLLDLLEQAVSAGRQVLEEGLGDGPSPVSGKRGPAVSVRINTSPQGATVRVDGEMVCTETPCTASIPSGVRRVQFDRAEYLPEQKNIEISKTADPQINVELSPRFSLVSVVTQPYGLSLTLDGKPVAGISKLKRRPGPIEVKIGHKCYHATGERVVLARGEHRQLNLSAQPRMSGVKVGSADPSGTRMAGQILADGELVGRFPGQHAVSVCTQRIELRPDQGSPQVHQVRLIEQQVTPVKPRSWGGR